MDNNDIKENEIDNSDNISIHSIVTDQEDFDSDNEAPSDQTNQIDKIIEESIEKISPNEKKFLSFDFYLRQNEKNKKELIELKDMFNRKISTIANNLVYMFKENDFTIEKTKNK